EALERLIGRSSDWARLDEFLIAYVVEPSLAPTVFASSFASTLEMVREGVMEVHQQGAFAPLYVRKRQPAGNGVADAGEVAGQTARDRGGPAMAKLKVVTPDDEPDNAGDVRAEELRLLEAMLFASAEPLDETSLAERLPQGVDVRAALLRLQEEYATRGVHLV